MSNKTAYKAIECNPDYSRPELCGRPSKCLRSASCASREQGGVFLPTGTASRRKELWARRFAKVSYQEREIEKVNTFYLQKEAEVCLEALNSSKLALCLILNNSSLNG